MLKGKTVVLGVTGSIAAYKMANVASALIKEGADVHVVMTKNATNFINPITFETLTNNKCLVDTFDRNFQFHVAHVSLSQKADVMMIAPASANIIGKLANGIADDMLSTMALAADCKIIVAPAMNTYMYKNRIVQDNLKKLTDYGFEIIKPSVGRLACASVGEGKLPDEDILLEYIRQEIQFEKDMQGVNILVTAGPTIEKIDPVRYITNHSSGKMGYAIAETAVKRGANVTLISGPVNIKQPLFANVINVESADDMYNAVMANFSDCDIMIKAAAVADYTVEDVSTEKIKKNNNKLTLDLTRTKDILKSAGQMKRKNQVICGFSMETSNLIENSKRKLQSKNCDMIIANNLKDEGAGFGVDTNKVTIITDNDTTALDVLSKKQVAEKILDSALMLYHAKNEE
ncbi:MAG: bifunctional phosphopantothenoylcysteine decarboxylase/phosphopantothenate--cysteine ligase CoaBC [Acetobacter sp.]|nr:bifunctional phosphopantothenoylcysteine decarboxylase/phosphopantothenate--cysteine ligase CoaBC [Bacteroides sp.]MCM1340203.1 bifunctional phosphopantothenoylcysteine decarboxylase/phosphopantothenate--cysteine ligase CoaBC [Acetobacter sp.]MCM1432845.1 bifunctional phosphopantothenoylcysteine decarboxylase/phosphopantothenate--cysteine ligase CoaBC [Clostridiales bacterium]